MTEPVIIERRGSDAILYRADDEVGHVEMPMGDVYANATRPTYFMNNIRGSNGRLNYSQLNQYAKRGGRKIKVFGLHEGETVRLLDMRSVATYNWLKERLTPTEQVSLAISFPLKNGVMKRESEPETKRHDDASLKAICRILEDGEIADGYASAQQYYNSGRRGFHSEVGLCPFAFRKYKVIFTKEANIPPNVVRKTKNSTANKYTNNTRAYRLDFSTTPTRTPTHQSLMNTMKGQKLSFGGRIGHKRTRKAARKHR